MKYFLDKTNNTVFAITNFEYTPNNNEIEIAENEYNKFLESLVVQPSEQELKENLRFKRKILLEAFDKWEKAVLRGRKQDDLSIMNWYYELLDLKETAFVNVPIEINYYL